MLRKFIAWFGITGGFAFIVLWIAAVVGWVMNIVKLVAMMGEVAVTPMFIARILGVPFGPLGAVLGWF